MVFCNLHCCAFIMQAFLVWSAKAAEADCGRQGVTSNGISAEIGEFPWMALLKYKDTEGNDAGYRCVGSLISSRYVLTAATCASPQDASLFEVRLGEHDLTTESDCKNTERGGKICGDPVQNIAVEDVIAHEDVQNDIALIRLDQDVKYTDYIRPICLPTPETESAQPGDTVVATGWGRTISGELITVKKRVTSSIISREECAKEYENKRNITENILCTRPASTNALFTCVGDSGGPLMFSSNGRWQQEGVVSFGVGCGPKWADGNTRVRNYLGWIEENMKI